MSAIGAIVHLAHSLAFEVGGKDGFNLEVTPATWARLSVEPAELGRYFVAMTDEATMLIQTPFGLVSIRRANGAL